MVSHGTRKPPLCRGQIRFRRRRNAHELFPVQSLQARSRTLRQGSRKRRRFPVCSEFVSGMGRFREVRCNSFPTQVPWDPPSPTVTPSPAQKTSRKGSTTGRVSPSEVEALSRGGTPSQAYTPPSRGVTPQEHLPKSPDNDSVPSQLETAETQIYSSGLHETIATQPLPRGGQALSEVQAGAQSPHDTEEMSTPSWYHGTTGGKPRVLHLEEAEAAIHPPHDTQEGARAETQSSHDTEPMSPPEWYTGALGGRPRKRKASEEAEERRVRRQSVHRIERRRVANQKLRLGRGHLSATKSSNPAYRSRVLLRFDPSKRRAMDTCHSAPASMLSLHVNLPRRPGAKKCFDRSEIANITQGTSGYRSLKWERDFEVSDTILSPFPMRVLIQSHSSNKTLAALD